MHPLDRAHDWHSALDSTPFEDIFFSHLHHGIVILTQDTLVLARRISSTWSESSVLDYRRTDPAGDTLHVWLLVGHPRLAFRSLIPPGVRFLSYHRGYHLIVRPLPDSFVSEPEIAIPSECAA